MSKWKTGQAAVKPLINIYPTRTSQMLQNLLFCRQQNPSIIARVFWWLEVMTDSVITPRCLETWSLQSAWDSLNLSLEMHTTSYSISCLWLNVPRENLLTHNTKFRELYLAGYWGTTSTLRSYQFPIIFVGYDLIGLEIPVKVTILCSPTPGVRTGNYSIWPVS